MPSKENNRFLSFVNCTVSDTSKDAVGLPGHLGTLLVQVQPRSLSVKHTEFYF